MTSADISPGGGGSIFQYIDHCSDQIGEVKESKQAELQLLD